MELHSSQNHTVHMRMTLTEDTPQHLIPRYNSLSISIPPTRRCDFMTASDLNASHADLTERFLIYVHMHSTPLNCTAFLRVMSSTRIQETNKTLKTFYMYCIAQLFSKCLPRTKEFRDRQPGVPPVSIKNTIVITAEIVEKHCTNG